MRHRPATDKETPAVLQHDEGRGNHLGAGATLKTTDSIAATTDKGCPVKGCPTARGVCPFHVRRVNNAWFEVVGGQIGEAGFKAWDRMVRGNGKSAKR